MNTETLIKYLGKHVHFWYTVRAEWTEGTINEIHLRQSGYHCILIGDQIYAETNIRELTIPNS